MQMDNTFLEVQAQFKVPKNIHIEKEIEPLH